MAEEGGQERSHEATPRKLERARRQGEVIQARDLLSFGAYLGLLLAWRGAAVHASHDVGAALLPFLERPDALAGIDRPGGLSLLLAETTVGLGSALLPFLGLPALCVLLALVVQRGLVVAPSRVAFKISRISPLANARQRFGAQALVDFGKSFLKLASVAALAGLLSRDLVSDAPALVRTEPAALAPLLLEILIRLLVPVVALTALFGAVDYLFQRTMFLRRQRMTPQEMREEQKEGEGDPHLKRARRERAVAMATNRMLRDVPGADVVITNPTHFAIALKWERERQGAAPHIVAKGVDEIALTIRRLAEEHGIPRVEDRPLARSLHDLVDLGQEIRVEHYRAVAAALLFATRQREKKRRV